jgi:AbrB family looped-hinge helix DNA binding protein
MPIAVMTSKGQLTIPKAVRDALSLKSGDEVEIEVVSEDSALLRRRPSAGVLPDAQPGALSPGSNPPHA